MSADPARSHVQLADELRRRVERSGALDPTLRRKILNGAPIDSDVPASITVLARHVDVDSFRVADAHVQAVLAETASEKSTFEVILTAAIGAGLRRWDAASRAIAEVDDATS